MILCLGDYSVLVKRHRPVVRWILKKHSTTAQPLTVRGRRSLKLARGWDGTAGRGWKADEELDLLGGCEKVVFGWSELVEEEGGAASVRDLICPAHAVHHWPPPRLCRKRVR